MPEPRSQRRFVSLPGQHRGLAARSQPPSHPRRGTLIAATAAAAATAATAALLIGAAEPATAAPDHNEVVPQLNLPGLWANLAVPGAESMTPAVWEAAGGDAYVVLLSEMKASEFTYEAAEISPLGTVLIPPSSIFGTHYWGSLSDQPTIVGQGANPLVVFDGSRSNLASDPYSRSCVVGAVGPTLPWGLQTWSLSASCYNPVGAATETANGEISAAWPGSFSTKTGIKKAVIYRIGEEPTIPAKTPDDTLVTEADGDVASVAEAADLAGKGDVYVTWVQEFSKPASYDGYWVSDLSSKGAPKKAPGSGENSINEGSLFAHPAMANTSDHPGVFVAYCSNAPVCNVLLWKVGSSKALTVPGSAQAGNMALSTGPDGRLWVAWYNHSTNKVSTVRTNMADTAFGPVETYKTSCFEDGLLGLSGGQSGRLDVVMECVNNKTLKAASYFTQSLAGLALGPANQISVNSSAQKVAFQVTDAGDPVSGATVTVDGRSGVTTSLGTATVLLPKGLGAGKYTATATAPNYFPAKATLTVTVPPTTTSS
jgi:hypothetical protein